MTAVTHPATAHTAPVQSPAPNISPAKAAGRRVEEKLIELEERIAAFCPPGMTPGMVRHSTMVALGSNAALLKVDPMSVVMSAIIITQWGLQIGQTAYILPYGGVATPVADYKGYIELITATRLVKNVNAKEIREADVFEYTEGEPIVHRPHWRDKTGPIIGAYCSMPTVAGGYIQEVMNVQEIEAIRAKSFQWSPSKHRELPYWYARKTAVRRAAKSAPKSARLQYLVNYEDDAGNASEEAMDLVSSGNLDALPAGSAPEYAAPATSAPVQNATAGYGVAEEDSVL